MSQPRNSGVDLPDEAKDYHLDPHGRHMWTEPAAPEGEGWALMPAARRLTAMQLSVQAYQGQPNFLDRDLIHTAKRIEKYLAGEGGLMASPPEFNPFEALDEAYRERAHLVAHLAALYPSTLVPATSDDWAIVYIELPGKPQASWHISATDLELFSHVKVTNQFSVDVLDGHSSEEKYRRLDEATRQIAEVRVHPAPSWEKN